MSWWKEYPWRMVQTNLREIDMENMNADAYAQSLKDFGATVVLLNAAGIIASYETKLPFQTKSSFLHGDSLHEVIDACHAKGIKVIARTDFSKVRYPLYEQHPEWAVRTKDGDIINYNGDVHVCPNSDYQQKYMLEILKEVLTEFPFDGVFCNMSGFLVMSYSGKYYGPCHCENCRKKFKDMFGLDIPDKDDMHDPAYLKYLAFKNICTKKHKEDIIRTVRAISPEIAINGVDYIRTESNTEMDRDQWVYSASMNSRLTEGIAYDRPADNACVDFIGFRYRDISVSPYQVSLRQWQNLANAGSVSLYLMGDLENHKDVSAIKASRPAFAFHQEHESLFANQKSIAKTVLVRSLPPQYPDPEYQGWVRILTESHIPFDEIRSAELKDIKQLEGKNVLILGENKMLSEDLAKLADEFASQGGTVIANGLTGILGRNGKPLAQPLLNCLGLQRIHGISNKSMSAMFEQKEEDKKVFTRSSDTPYLAPGQTVVKAVPCAGAQTYLSLVDEHPFGPPERCYFTEKDVSGEPGVIVNSYGAGKGIYLAFDPGAMFMKQGYTNTLTYVQDVLFELAGDESLAPDLTPMVETTVKKIQDGILIQLVNTSGFFGNTYYQPLPVNEINLVIPQDYLTSADLKQLDSLSVKALNGGTIDALGSNGDLKITLNQLKDYEAITIKEKE